MQQTNHYQLSQWDFEDQIVMADFNSDNQKTDAALHGLAEQAAGKADAAALNSLTGRVNQKAEQSALAAEQAARQNADSAEQAARIAGDSAEKAAREAADGALGARIDALTPKAGFHLINRIELTAAQEAVKLDLTSMDWNQWATVRIQCKPVISGAYRVRYNNSSLSYMGEDLYSPFQIHLYCNFDETMCAYGTFWPPYDNKNCFCGPNPISNLISFDFSVRNSPFQPGTVIEVWGSK